MKTFFFSLGDDVMSKLIGSPTRYRQGKDELKKLGEDLKEYKRLVVITSENLKEMFIPSIEESLVDQVLTVVLFNNECSISEIERIKHIVEESSSDVIIGVGGGKVLDTTKAVGYYTHKPIVIVPTAASTDAPCSSLSVIYHDDHTFDHYLYLPKSPDQVIVDTQVIANAPVRLLRAGIGDAFSTYFEARACFMSHSENCLHGLVTRSALAMSKACFDLVYSYGIQAIEDCKYHKVSEALENVIEANIYLSGIGFESGGEAMGHGLHNAFTLIPETHKCMHGEKVAFCTLVQLVLENTPKDTLKAYYEFLEALELPTTLKDMNVIEPDKEILMKVCKEALKEGSTALNMPFEVTAESLYQALIQADRYGHKWKTSGK